MNQQKDFSHQMSLNKTSSTMLSKDFQEVQRLKKELNDNVQLNKMSAKSKEFMPGPPSKRKKSDYSQREEDKELPLKEDPPKETKKTMRVGQSTQEFKPFLKTNPFIPGHIKPINNYVNKKPLYNSQTQQNIQPNYKQQSFQQSQQFQSQQQQPFNTQQNYQQSFQQSQQFQQKQELPAFKGKLTMKEKQILLQKQQNEEQDDDSKDVGKWEQTIPKLKNEPKLVSKKEQMRLRQQQNQENKVFTKEEMPSKEENQPEEQVLTPPQRKSNEFMEVQTKALETAKESEELSARKVSSGQNNNNLNMFSALGNPLNNSNKKAKKKKSLVQEDTILKILNKDNKKLVNNKQKEQEQEEEREREKEKQLEKELQIEKEKEQEKKKQEEEKKRKQKEENDRKEKQQKQKKEEEEKKKREEEEVEKKKEEENKKEEKEKENNRFKRVKLSDQILIRLILHRREELNTDNKQKEEIVDKLPELIRLSIIREIKTEVQDQQIERNKNQYDNKQYNKNNKYNQNKNQYNKQYNKNNSQANINTNAQNINRQPVDLERQKMQERSGEWLKKMQIDDEDEALKIKKQIGFTLNILTPDNYEKAKDKLISLSLSSNQTMDTFIQMILEKAWEDKLYVPLYANLCHTIQETQKEKQGDENIADNKFKTQLLTKIQQVFENQKVTKEEMSAEVYENIESHTDLLRKQKRRILGNIKFIGELYLVKLLPAQIINHVSSMLIVNFIKEYYGFHALNKKECQNYENQLEALEVLTERIGQKREIHIEQDSLLHKRNQQNLPECQKKVDRFQAQLDNTKHFIQVIHTLNPVASRVPLPNYSSLESSLVTATNNLYLTIIDVENILKHFISKYNLTRRMQSVLEILFHKREGGWKEIFMQGEGPKTIKEIGEEHLKNQRQVEQETQEYIDKERRHKPSQRDSRHDRDRRDDRHRNNNNRRSERDIKQDSYYNPQQSQTQPHHKNSFDNLQNFDEEKDRAEKLVMLEKEFKCIFKEPETEFIEKSKQLLANNEALPFMKAFLGTFFEGSKEKILTRLPIIITLFQQNLIDSQTLLTAINTNVFKYYALYEDNPHLIPLFSLLLTQLYQEKAFTYDALIVKLQLDTNDTDYEDELENQQYFYSQLLENIAKSLTQKSLLDQYLQKQLIQLCHQIKLEDTSFIVKINKKP